MLKTPVLFLIFNRPDVTALIFEKIKKQKPKYLYIAGDGPRNNREGEAELCEQTRKIATNIDWDCEVKTLFREKNLGCKVAVSSAITWFFQNVEEGIILEDDCLPHPSFFGFCEAMLEKYRDNEQIMHIAGDTQLADNMTDDSYYFSHIPHIWGWASWKRAWKDYDVEMKDFSIFLKKQKIKNVFENKYHQKDWLNILNKVYKNEIDTWDYQWCYTVFKKEGLAIIPNKNLISNIGFGENSTHTSEASTFSDKTLSPMDDSLKHPKAVSINKDIQHRALNERFNMPDKFSVDRHYWLKILIRETKRALYKAGINI